MTRELWRIEKLVPGGAGMARRADGSIGFAMGALPGETIEIERISQKKGYAQARGFRLLEASAERVTPLCPVAASCGGCDWLHLSYDAQLRHKAALLAEALTRTGGFRVLPAISVAASPRPSGYRSRIRLHIDEEGRFGFYAADSHRLVEVPGCPAALPELAQAFALFEHGARRFPSALAAFAEVELRVAPTRPERALYFTPRRSAAAARAEAEPLLTELGQDFSVAVAGSASDFVQRWPLADSLWLEVPPDAFVQVNWEVNLQLVQSLVDGARQLGARRFLDIYAGAGNFTLALAAAGLAGVSIEGHPGAASSAERSCRGQGLLDVKVVNADVKTALARLEVGAGFDLAILDPPRAGAAEILTELVALAPRAIAYCSCDPVTLARDLRTLAGRGYALERVQGFDMFPGTHHVEALAWLSRRAGSAQSSSDP
jgi:23S rRNA (uracil1939-C5)-methyltransferase